MGMGCGCWKVCGVFLRMVTVEMDAVRIDVTGRPVSTGRGRQVDRTVPGPPVVGVGMYVGFSFVWFRWRWMP